MSYIETEIYEQPQAVARLLETQAAYTTEIAGAIRAFKPAFVWIAARGTSDNAARYAQYALGVHARLAVGLATPSVHTLYDTAPDLSHALVIGISQSGQSDDVRRVIDDARAQGALTLSMTNDPESPLAQGAQFHLALSAGREYAVAATKTYTAELAAVALLTAELTESESLWGDLSRLPEHMDATLRLSDMIGDWAGAYREMREYAVIGRGYNYCTAYEISLKIKEMCGIPGEEYSEADFRHGPIAVVEPGFPVLVVAAQGDALERQVDLLKTLTARGAETFAITNAPEAETAVRVLSFPADVPEWLSPLTAVIPGQLLAMHLAAAKGYDVDKSSGLTKVTITR